MATVPLQNSIWGPPLWRILHTLASRLGNNSNHLVAADEARTWLQLLRTVEPILPCSMCRRHFRTWKHAHSIERFAPARGPPLKELAVEWLFSLHENVNRERSVPGITLEECEALYKSRTSAEMNEDVSVLTQSLSIATQTGIVDPLAVRSWKAALSLMRRLINV